MTHCVLERDRRPAVRRALPVLLQKRTDRAGRALRDHLKQSLDNGEEKLYSDTGATAESLYVQSPGGTDYDERLAAAATAYLEHDSKYLQAVRATVDPTAYTDEHFAARVAPPGELPPGIVTAVATFFAVGFYWQMGHQNEFTGRYERRSWFADPTLKWAVARLESFYAEFEAELEVLAQ